MLKFKKNKMQTVESKMETTGRKIRNQKNRILQAEIKTERQQDRARERERGGEPERVASAVRLGEESEFRYSKVLSDVELKFLFVLVYFPILSNHLSATCHIRYINPI